LLAIKGSTQRERLTIGELAEQLQIMHHAAIELVDRLSAQNLIERHSGRDDRRKVFVQLSRTGSKILDKLSASDLICSGTGGAKHLRTEPYPFQGGMNTRLFIFVRTDE
jgi:DNA-binding MarR family transcriptional regulator